MNSTFVQQIANQVLPPLAILIGSGLVALIGFASKWLSDHVKSQKAKDLIASVTESIDTAVKDVSNNEADAIRKTLEAGKGFSAEDRANLKKIAVDKAKSLLGAATLANLAKHLGYTTDQQMIDFLASYVEKGVWEMQLQKSAAALATPVVTIAIPKVVTPA